MTQPEQSQRASGTSGPAIEKKTVEKLIDFLKPPSNTETPSSTPIVGPVENSPEKQE
jgi:hypothetical protein